MQQQTLLLIDGFNLLSRGHFATSYGREDHQLKNSQGIYTNALRVFFQKLVNLIAEYDVSHLAIAWDVKREELKRRMMFPDYKATRSELPSPLLEQYETCKTILDNIGIQQISIPAFEADDVIGSLSTKWNTHANGNCYIYSNDRDLFQLLNDNVSQIIASKKGEFVYSLTDFEAEYGITSRQWVDVKALLGDTSDNIPGCPGVGEKSALPLIQQYGSIESIYEQIEELDKKFNRYKKKLIEGKDYTFISKQLSEIICDLEELEDILFEELELSLNHDQLTEQFMELELKIKLA